jgi:hypothetical protein
VCRKEAFCGAGDDWKQTKQLRAWLITAQNQNRDNEWGQAAEEAKAHVRGNKDGQKEPNGRSWEYFVISRSLAGTRPEAPQQLLRYRGSSSSACRAPRTPTMSLLVHFFSPEVLATGGCNASTLATLPRRARTAPRLRQWSGRQSRAAAGPHAEASGFIGQPYGHHDPTSPLLAFFRSVHLYFWHVKYVLCTSTGTEVRGQKRRSAHIKQCQWTGVGA